MGGRVPAECEECHGRQLRQGHCIRSSFVLSVEYAMGEERSVEHTWELTTLPARVHGRTELGGLYEHTIWAYGSSFGKKLQHFGHLFQSAWFRHTANMTNISCS